MSKMNITQARHIVVISYEIILDRDASSKEVDHWAKKLVSGEINETDLIYYFVTSKEYKEKRKKDG